MGQEMKEENWIRNTNPVREWLNDTENNEKTDAIRQVIDIGDNAETDEMRFVYWGAVRNMGKACQDMGFPKGNIGKPSTLPQEKQDAVRSAKNRLVRAFAGIGEAELILATIYPHARTGGAFGTIEDFAEAMAEKAVSNMTKAHKQGRWLNDDVMVGDIPNITPPPVKVKKAQTEEVSEEE